MNLKTRIKELTNIPRCVIADKLEYKSYSTFRVHLRGGFPKCREQVIEEVLPKLEKLNRQIDEL